MIEIIPTVVPNSLSEINEVSERYSSFASFFHIDVADGRFAPNTTWLPSEGDRLPKDYSYEVHLMVSDPHAVGLAFAKAGAHTLIGHIEAFGNAKKAKRAFEEWKNEGAHKVGVGMLLQTPLEEIEPYLPFVDFVLFMTIARIGVQGIPFDERGIARIAEFRSTHPNVALAVDGGVSEENIADLVRAGATRFGVGSAISKSADPSGAYARLRKCAEGV